MSLLDALGGEPAAETCSRAGCREAAVWRIDWRNSRIHDEDRRKTWLACDASVSVAAARLYAHRHTIRYRLDRVKELSGLDPSATEDREQLALGLRARRVLDAAGRLDPG